MVGRAGHHKAAGLGCLIALVYAPAYLYAIGDINPGRAQGLAWRRLMPDPTSLMWHRRFGLQFEGMAILELPGLTWLVSPVNAFIGITLGGLVGVNAVRGYRAYQRRSCTVGSTTASLATVPALLSGAACCAPVTLLALGLPVTASLMTLSQWLVPLAAALLIASAGWLAYRTR